MKFLHKVAKERGAQRVRLNVDPRNHAAVELYRSLSYVLQSQPDGQSIGFLELE
jgi:ribosomal protein S18 acetylase RimI-like enzyme